MDGRPAAWQSDLAHGLQGLQGLQGPSQACPVPCQVPCQITPRPWGDPFLGDQLPAARKVAAAPAIFVTQETEICRADTFRDHLTEIL